MCNAKTKTFVLLSAQEYENVLNFSNHVSHSNYNSTLRAFFANKFMYQLVKVLIP